MRWFATLLSSLLVAVSAAATPPEPRIRVLSFNVMCSICRHTSTIGNLAERMEGIADTINRHDPDLVSLQELFTGVQARKLQQRLDGDYEAVFANELLFGYADPTLLIRKSRFRVLRSGGFWLGPNPAKPNLGWMPAYPRRVEWAELEDRNTGRRFTFAGTHFDANRRNRNPSAELVVEMLLARDTPVLFAGDLNLRPTSDGFAPLAASFRDTFTEVAEHPYVANGPTSNADGCDLDSVSVFPDCRIDHVLLSPDAPWRTRAWSIDVFRYERGFASDHRAIVVDLE